MRCRDMFPVPGLGAFYCDLPHGHSGRHEGKSSEGRSGAWGRHPLADDFLDTKPPVVSENPALYGTADASNETAVVQEFIDAMAVKAMGVPPDELHCLDASGRTVKIVNLGRSDEGAENRFHRAGSEFRWANLEDRPTRDAFTVEMSL